MASHVTSALCSNPFNESGHNNVRNNLRNILTWMTEKLPQLNNDHKVCDKCHKISKLKCDASNKQKDDDSDSDKTEQFARITAMQSLNESLQSTGESPIKKKRLGEGKYLTTKINRIEKAVKAILNIPENVNSSAVFPSPDTEKQSCNVAYLMYGFADLLHFATVGHTTRLFHRRVNMATSP
jgi:hypothetical protein